MKIEYSNYDFSEEIFDWGKQYKLTNECIIFHRLYDDQILDIFIYKKCELSKYIKIINDYMDWLGKHCKGYFEEAYCNLFDHKNKYDGNEWYFNIDCYAVDIKIDKNENISAEIIGMAFSLDYNGWYHHDIKLEGMKIISWERR